MGLSLSSAWNAFLYNSARNIIRQIKGAGFEEVELSFNLTEKIVSQIEKMVRDGFIRVSSLHNFCPIPDGIERSFALPDCYSMSSLNDNERRLSVKYTKRSIDTAKKLNAKAVVVHAGRAEAPERTRDLISLYDMGLQDSPEFMHLKEQAIKERQESIEPFLENAVASLRELGEYASDNGISIGVENRFYYAEIPSFAEIGIILERLKGLNIYYWHDCGHAQVMDNLGLADHKEHLRAYHTKMLGVHMHDARGCLDHLPPPQGDIDFNAIAPFIKKETIKVIEAHYPASSAELNQSKKYFEVILDGKI